MITLLRFGVFLIAIPAMTIPVAAGCLSFTGPVTDYERPIAPYEWAPIAAYEPRPFSPYERPPIAPYEPRSFAPYEPRPIAAFERPPIAPYEPRRIAPYESRPIAPRYYVGHRPAPMRHVAKHSLPQQRDEKAPPASPPPALPLREGRPG